MDARYLPDPAIGSPGGKPGARAAVVLSVALVLAACATAGREFPESQVRNIRIGQTTQAQIRSMFGPPWRTGLDDGQETWTYGRYRYSIVAPESTSDLKIRFDANGVVISYSYSTTADRK